MKAFQFFNCAADDGHPIGQFNYGICCDKGEEISVNFFQALEYFLLSTAKNYRATMRAYSHCLAKGLSVAMNLRGSLSWLHPSFYATGWNLVQ
jgi:TPR repeat protein